MIPLLFAAFGNIPVLTQDPCRVNSFFGLKPWYAYLQLNPKDCTVSLDLTDPQKWNQLWLIGLVIFEDILRIAAVVAVGFIVYGGIRFITSQGEPQNNKEARDTIVNALIGLVITIAAASLVSFVGGRIRSF